MEPDEKTTLGGLNYASLNYTEADYAEAVKLVDSPASASDLLDKLIDVSCRANRSQDCDATSSSCPKQNQTKQTANQIDESLILAGPDRESSSSCYSSISCSLDQSLESLQVNNNNNSNPTNLRKIYIDGPNVARTHGMDVSFSWKGICLCVDWFLVRQHRVKVLVPEENCQIAPEEAINYLKASNALIITPSGCNDDLFIIEAARKTDGIIVSNDLYRDEKRFNDDLQRFIHLNRLPYIFDDDQFIPANDPRGRSGPTLDEFLLADHQAALHRSLMKVHFRHRKNGSLVKPSHYNPGIMHRRSLQAPRGPVVVPLISLDDQSSSRDLIGNCNDTTSFGESRNNSKLSIVSAECGQASIESGACRTLHPLGNRRRAVYRPKAHNNCHQ